MARPSVVELRTWQGVAQELGALELAFRGVELDLGLVLPRRVAGSVHHGDYLTASHHIAVGDAHLLDEATKRGGEARVT
jgi:hypothetical protein